MSSQEKIEPARILYFENPPRFDYRFLRAALQRDETVRFRSFLASADKEWEHPASAGEAPLTRETALATLRDPQKLDAVDLVIWGDLELEHLTPEVGAQEEIARTLKGFVEGGRGLLFIGGLGYSRLLSPGKPLAELLPATVKPIGGAKEEAEVKALIEKLGDGSIVEREAAEVKLREFGPKVLIPLAAAARSSDPEIRLRARGLLERIPAGLPADSEPRPIRPTAVGRGHEALKVADRETWDRAPKLRWWVSGLALQADARALVETDAGDPVLIVRSLGKGRAAYLATDEWWLWRYLRGDADYYATYRALFRWLAGR